MRNTLPRPDHSAPPSEPYVPFGTVGAAPVAMTDRALSYRIQLETMDPDFRASPHGAHISAQPAWLDKMASAALQGVKRTFANLDAEQANEINRHLDSQTPPFLRRLKDGVGDSPRSWSDWLTRQASDEQILNLLQWNVDHNTRRQDNPEFAQIVARRREQCRIGIRNGVATGSLSKSVLGRLDQIDSTPVGLADPLYATIRNILGEAAFTGIHERPRDIVLDVPDDNIAEADKHIMHEFAHVVVQDTNDSLLNVPWIGEALTEISATIIQPGKPVTAYHNEVALYDTLLSDGSFVINSKTGTVAYSGTPKDKQRFYRQLDTAWGTDNVLQKVNDYVASIEQSLSHEKIPTPGGLAARLTRESLERSPQLIFGESYQRPTAPSGIVAILRRAARRRGVAR